MKREGNICKWYLGLEGCCFLNGAGCYSPFSCEGCDIQCRDIFYRNPPTEYKNYEPNKKNETETISEIKKELVIKKGDIIGELIVPYDEIDACCTDIMTIINNAKEQVREKFKKAETKMDFIRVFHNIEILPKVYGVYIIGVSRE